MNVYLTILQSFQGCSSTRALGASWQLKLWADMTTLCTSCPVAELLRHDQTVDAFSFRHAKTGPENIDVLLFSKRGAIVVCFHYLVWFMFIMNIMTSRI